MICVCVHVCLPFHVMHAACMYVSICVPLRVRVCMYVSVSWSGDAFFSFHHTTLCSSSYLSLSLCLSMPPSLRIPPHPTSSHAYPYTFTFPFCFTQERKLLRPRLLASEVNDQYPIVITSYDMAYHDKAVFKKVKVCEICDVM